MDERDPHESAFAENCEIDLLALHRPKVVMQLEDAWVRFVSVQVHCGRKPLWRPWVMHIFHTVKLPREFK